MAGKAAGMIQRSGWSGATPRSTSKFCTAKKTMTASRTEATNGARTHGASHGSTNRSAIGSAVRSAIVGRRTAIVPATAPHHVERVTFGATIGIFDAHDGGATLTRIADQLLAAASIDALEAEFGRIPR